MGKRDKKDLIHSLMRMLMNKKPGLFECIDLEYYFCDMELHSGALSIEADSDSTGNVSYCISWGYGFDNTSNHLIIDLTSEPGQVYLTFDHRRLPDHTCVRLFQHNINILKRPIDSSQDDIEYDRVGIMRKHTLKCIING